MNSALNSKFSGKNSSLEELKKEIEKIKHDMKNILQNTQRLLETGAVKMPHNVPGKEQIMRAIEYLEQSRKQISASPDIAHEVNINEIVKNYAAILQTTTMQSSSLLDIQVCLDKRIKSFKDKRKGIIDSAILSMLINAAEMAESKIKISTGLILSPLSMSLPHIAVTVEHNGQEMQVKTLKKIAEGKHLIRTQFAGFGIPAIKEAGLELEGLHIFSNAKKTSFSLVIRPYNF